MASTICNTRPEAPRVTLIGQLDDGTYAGEVLEESGVPYTRYWENAIDQAVVYLEPDERQLEKLLEALNEGRITFRQLQEFGSSKGGTSRLPV
jgi:hypothetical protein